jgi:4-amino-4-deoxy-L-arabinose transferase-like glycosyltransferase
MPFSNASEMLRTRIPSHAAALPLFLIIGGLATRLVLAHRTFLNPDEALHYLLSAQPSLALVYKASLTTAHPPLLIVLLHYWLSFGNSEFVLRLPSMLTGTAFCWIMFLWLQRVTDRTTALVGLALLSFSPSLISLSAENRQYSLLMFFCAASLYLLDRAISENSLGMMLFSSLSLYLALLTHYSSFIFALTLGIYALARIWTSKPQTRLVVTWIVAQLGALTLCAFSYVSHISRLKSSGLPGEIADTWLRTSIFHSGQDHLASFCARTTIRLFRYFFSHGTIGVLGLLFFVLGMVWLLRDKTSRQGPRNPTSWQLALLLGLPFAITLSAALAGLYPYGGTRHDALLAGFAMAGISIGLTRPGIWKKWLTPTAVAGALLICNLFPSPTPPYILPKNQNRKLMNEATNYLRRSAPEGSVLFTDYQGALMLSYYFCPARVVPFEQPPPPFLKSDCGEYKVVAFTQTLWSFNPATFASTLREMQQMYGIGSDSAVWLFQAGWIDENEDEWIAELRQRGCHEPRNFGPNILICQMTLH